MSEFSNILKYYRKREGLTQEELAARLGVRKSTICNYENGYSQPTIATLQLLAEFFHISLDVLMGKIQVREPSDSSIIILPVLSSSTAEPTDENLTFPSTYLKNGNYFAIYLPDDAMASANLHRGDLVICQKQLALQNGDLAAVFVDDMGVLLRYYYIEENQITLISSGKNLPLRREQSEITILGKAIKAVVSF